MNEGMDGSSVGGGWVNEWVGRVGEGGWGGVRWGEGDRWMGSVDKTF